MFLKFLESLRKHQMCAWTFRFVVRIYTSFRAWQNVFIKISRFKFFFHGAKNVMCFQFATELKFYFSVQLVWRNETFHAFSNLVSCKLLKHKSQYMAGQNDSLNWNAALNINKNGIRILFLTLKSENKMQHKKLLIEVIV